MKNLTAPEFERFRVEMPPELLKLMGTLADYDRERNGAFSLKVGGVNLHVIAAAGGGWDHVSVSTETRCPTWSEMELIAKLFFKDDEVAMQLHVPATDHINNHPFTLHIWRPRSKLKKIPLPPKSFV